MSVSHRTVESLYLVNASLLLTHEIDSAYWQEWDLLHIPGGIQVFLVLNWGLILVVLYGLRALVLRRKVGLWFSLGLATCGVLAFLIHGSFLMRGDPRFRVPASLLVLALSAVVSMVQGVLTWRLALRDPDSPAAPITGAVE